VARFLEVPAGYFLGNDIERTLPPNPKELLEALARHIDTCTYYRAPELEDFPAGPGKPSYEELEQHATRTINIPEHAGIKGKRTYLLRVKAGMEHSGIRLGELVIVDYDAPLQDGELYVLRIGKQEAVEVARVYLQESVLILVDSKGQKREALAKDVVTLGKVIAYGHWTLVDESLRDI
jgi:hypothetical protein